MATDSEFTVLKDLAAGRPASEDVVALYHEAFQRFGALALWSTRRLERPTIAQVLGVGEALRVEGNLAARALSVRIEDACRAAL